MYTCQPVQLCMYVHEYIILIRSRNLVCTKLGNYIRMYSILICELQVLTSFIRASSPEDLCTETLRGRVLIEAINNTLNTTKWFVKVEKVESVKKQLTQATIKKVQSTNTCVHNRLIHITQ